MGYYDNEPQPAENATSTEAPAGAFDEVQTEATQDEGFTGWSDKDGWGDRDKKYY